ncbi:hypothetical protein CXB51_013634 [Gossypium anomalum]|uniref:Uncharacterized protein n=1 Tax=Gossypium anomalum TaxID=47600 RepID=A0A8J5YWE4_9ROSI|nr:hypothetical protein CXB51_013634 [Gossypium anomalum]
MISGSGSCFPSASQGQDQSHSITLLYNLSILKDKGQEAKSLVSILIPPDQAQPESTSLSVSSTASSNRCLLEPLQKKGKAFILMLKRLAGMTTAAITTVTTTMAIIGIEVYELVMTISWKGKNLLNCLEEMKLVKGVKRFQLRIMTKSNWMSQNLPSV